MIEQNPNPLLADSDRVQEFVTKLTAFRGDNDADLYRVDPTTRGLDPTTYVTVTVTAREESDEGEPDAPAREYKLRIGTPDIAAGKLPVQLVGWPRITLVSDRAGGFRRRPAGFRRCSSRTGSNRCLSETRSHFAAVNSSIPTRKLSGVFALRHRGNCPRQKKPDGADEWKLAARSPGRRSAECHCGAVTDLGNLRATEFLAESAANPAEYGLDKPKFTVTLAFDKRTYKFEVGNAAWPSSKG